MPKSDMRRLLDIVAEGALAPSAKHGEIVPKWSPPGFEETWEPYKEAANKLQGIPPNLSDEDAVEAMAVALVRHGMEPSSYRLAAARWNAATTDEERDTAAAWITGDDGPPGIGLAMRVLVSLSVQRGGTLLGLFPLLMRAAKRAAASVHDTQASGPEPKMLGRD